MNSPGRSFAQEPQRTEALSHRPGRPAPRSDSIRPVPRDRAADLEAARRAVAAMRGNGYVPHRWLRGPHQMTVGGWALGLLATEPRSEIRRIPVRPGVEVLAKVSRQPGPAPALILIHGLEGSSDAGYMRGVGARALRAGFHVVRLNQRGCGGSWPLTDTPYHAGLTEDLAAAIEGLVAEGFEEVYAAGFSLGANQLLKYLGEVGERPPTALRAAVAVSVPIDLGAAADALHRPSNRGYEWSFVRSLTASYRRFHRRSPARFPPPPRVQSLRQFDDLVAGPSHGFAGADDYYARSSSGPWLASIRVPTLILQAEDDPMIPFGAFRAQSMGDHALLWATPRGGHVGFLAAGAERRWAEARVVEFVDRVRGVS